MPMEGFWIQLLAILTLLTQTCSPSDTTKVIGAVGGSVTFRSPSTDGNSAMWSFGNVPIVTVLFGDPPQFIFLKEEYKTHFTVSESGRALSISQLSTEDSGIYSANIHGKIFTFTLLVYRELPEPRVTCEAQDCSDTPSDCGDRIGITVGVVVAVVMGMIICFFLFSFCKSKGYWPARAARLASGSAETSGTTGPGNQVYLQNMSCLEPALGPTTDQQEPEPGVATDQCGPVQGVVKDQHRPEPGLASHQHNSHGASGDHLMGDKRHSDLSHGETCRDQSPQLCRTL